MKTTVSSKGQVVLPAELRERDKVRAGQQFQIERVQAGEYLLKRISAAGSPGLVEWLQACPDEDWYQGIPSESTDEL